MKKPDIADLEMMTPGSIWTRDNGKQRRFLFVANESLPTTYHKEYPPVVVYADENDNIMAVSIEAFLAKCKFFNVDPELETRLQNLLQLPKEETFDLGGGGEDDGDDLLVADDDAPDEMKETILSDDDSPFATGLQEDTGTGNMIDFYSEATGLPVVISAHALSAAIEGYVQAPLVSEKKIQHTLLFRPAFGITMDSLTASFTPANIETNVVYAFRVNSKDGTLDIDWDTFLGVYPMVRGGQTFYQVIFTTDAQIAMAKADNAVEAVAVHDVQAAQIIGSVGGIPLFNTTAATYVPAVTTAVDAVVSQSVPIVINATVAPPIPAVQDTTVVMASQQVQPATVVVAQQ
jgi:hypothetical protein